MSVKKRRKFPIVLSIIILIIIVFTVMLKWNSGYTQSVSGSTDVYNKFKDAIISGGTVSLSSDDINSIISRSFESQTHKGVTIEKVYVNIEKSKLDIKIPVAFKGQKFLVSSKGSVAFKDGCVEYLPDSFKIGAIPLSKSFILSKLKAMYSSKFTVNTDGIYINKSAVPLTINSVGIKDSKLEIGVEKLKINLGDSQASKIRDALANTLSNLNPSDKTKVKDAIKYIENNPYALSNIQSKLSGVSNSEVKKIVDEVAGTGKNNNGNQSTNNNSNSNSETNKTDPKLFARVSNNLSVALGKASDPGARAVISNIKSQVDSGSIDSGSIIAQYKALSKTQKLQVQVSLLSSGISSDDVSKLRSMCGI